MKKTAIVAFVTAAIFTGSCVENETSFFIEHAKSQPAAPECTSSASDPWNSNGLLDLALGTQYVNFFLVRNQLVSREDYDNLKAESNGIFIDAADVSIRTDANESLGAVRTSADGYLEPESSDLAAAELVSHALGEELRTRYNCPLFSPQAYPESTVYANSTDANGNEVGRQLGTIQAVVRFLGHTGGRLEVETPSFIYNISICCGCLIDWFSCQNPCERYCAEPDFGVSSCYPGVPGGDLFLTDCRQIYYNPDATWNDNCVDGDTENDPGQGTPRPCTCEDCS